MRAKLLAVFLSIILLSHFQSGCRPTFVSTPDPNLPTIREVKLDRDELPRYASLEIRVVIEAEYTNPYDAREVRLDGTLRGPGGQAMVVPGFWDGEEGWKLRFSPGTEGEWQYSLTVSDKHGTSEAASGVFQVTAAEEGRHGWIQPANWVNPEWSSHYLVYHDGTPFYGIGHCDALNILIDRFTETDGVGLLANMKAAGENFVVWWPLYSNSPVSSSYDTYNQANLAVIDMVVRDAEQKNLQLIFTIWDHPGLRAEGHAWGEGQWNRNGFSKLSTIDEFFSEQEPWAWQENLYRMIIARWGYSTAIGMWQTVTEINGTNAYGQTNAWHQKVNNFFVANDPYRHPTTASMSGDVDWPAGFEAMDAPQVHVYDLEDVTEAAETLARWTSLMWQYGKPNWVGEFGVTGTASYPELFHNAIWAALGAGAAMTPAEWNSGGSWGRLTPEMLADLQRLKSFVAEIPLARLNPEPLIIQSEDSDVRGWGVAGAEGGIIWVQDRSMQGKPIEELRAQLGIRSGASIAIQGLEPGTYTIQPYDTWQGTFLDSREITCSDDQACVFSLPDFRADIALRISRK